MKWLRFEDRGTEKIGVLDGDEVVVHDGDLFAGPRPTVERLPLDSLAFRPPCRPGKMIGLWNNFHAAAAKNGWAVPTEPLYFLKGANAYAAHRQTVPVPGSYDGRVVYEGELAVVIGRRLSAVDEAAAAAGIFGYACANDITALDLIGRDPAFAQWTRAKSLDAFGPFGPWIETDFDPARGEVATSVNGRERQRYPLSDMIFPPARLVSLISRDLTLEAGDVILCGTSLGVLPMRPGQRVEVTIDGIGTLSNSYGAEG